MDTLESLNHSVWDCKYHVVFSPNVGGRRCTRNCGNTWARCSGRWRGRRRVGPRKATYCRVMSRCSSPSRRSTRWRRWWGLSRGRTRSIWRGCTGSARGISWGNTSGRGYFVSTVGRDEGLDPRVHPEAGTRGRAPGPIGALALTSRRNRRDRVSDPSGAYGGRPSVPRVTDLC